MLKIVKYCLVDLLRSRWLIIYFLFFLLSSALLFYFSDSFSKVVISMLNIEITIVPLVSLLFGVMYYYNSREFIELLLSQPMKRTSIILGLYLGLSVSLSVCYLLGTSLTFLYYGMIFQDLTSFFEFILTGILLTFIFTAFAFLISLWNENRIKGFGLAILVWLFLVIVYDGIFLFVLSVFQDYPLEKPTIILTLFNPIDLSRVLVLLKLEISALMGYSGTVFKEFFGSSGGLLIAFLSMIVWVIFPLLGVIRLTNRKNF